MPISKHDKGGEMLVHVLLAIPFSLIAMYGMSQFMVMTIKSSQRMESQVDLDLVHTQALHTLRNVAYLRDIDGKNFETPLVPEASNQAFQNCLAGGGTGCHHFSTWVEVRDKAKMFSVPRSASGSTECGASPLPPCLFRQEARARWACGFTRCDRFEVSLKTYEDKPIKQTSTIHHTRENSIFISSRAFLDRSEIRFSCPQGGGLFTGIDFETYTARCGFGGTKFTTDPTRVPARMISSIETEDMANEPGVSKDCRMGFGVLGMFASRKVCASSKVDPVDAGDWACPHTYEMLPGHTLDYVFRGRVPNPMAIDFGVYMAGYGGYQLAIRCRGNTGGDPATWAYVCKAKCDFRIVRDCEGVIKRIEKVGDCAERKLAEMQEGNWLDLPPCYAHEELYSGFICQ